MRACMGDRLDPSTKAKDKRFLLIKLDLQPYKWVETVGPVSFFLKVVPVGALCARVSV